MRSKRRLFWFLAFAATGALLSGSAFICLTSKRVRTDKLMCDRIRPGMTRAEVESLLGCPPGHYSKYPVITHAGHSKAYVAWTSWVSEEGEILVLFDPEGKVARKAHLRVVPIGDSTLWGLPLKYLRF